MCRTKFPMFLSAAFVRLGSCRSHRCLAKGWCGPGLPCVLDSLPVTFWPALIASNRASCSSACAMSLKPSSSKPKRRPRRRSRWSRGNKNWQPSGRPQRQHRQRRRHRRSRQSRQKRRQNLLIRNRSRLRCPPRPKCLRIQRPRIRQRPQRPRLRERVVVAVVVWGRKVSFRGRGDGSWGGMGRARFFPPRGGGTCQRPVDIERHVYSKPMFVDFP